MKRRSYHLERVLIRERCVLECGSQYQILPDLCFYIIRMHVDRKKLYFQTSGDEAVWVDCRRTALRYQTVDLACEHFQLLKVAFGYRGKLHLEEIA